MMVLGKPKIGIVETDKVMFENQGIGAKNSFIYVRDELVGGNQETRIRFYKPYPGLDYSSVVKGVVFNGRDFERKRINLLVVTDGKNDFTYDDEFIPQTDNLRMRVLNTQNGAVIIGDVSEQGKLGRYRLEFGDSSVYDEIKSLPVDWVFNIRLGLEEDGEVEINILSGDKAEAYPSKFFKADSMTVVKKGDGF